MINYIDIVFDGPPSHESGRFVEVEDATGASISIGEWVQDGDFWRLRILDPRARLHAESVSLLADVEWAGTDSVYLTRFCVWCDANKKHGHAANCRYVTLMAKARLI